jgi:hypothetical protein
MGFVYRRTGIALVLAGLAAAPLRAAQAPNVRVAGRVQAHYRNAFGDSTAAFPGTGVNNSFEIRRLRMQTDVRFGDYINLSIQPSFEMGALRMRDAFLRVGFGPRVGLTIGQEKSPFQRYELTSSNNLLTIERGVRILGLSGREALNDLLFNNGYVSHDLGAFVDYTGPRASVKLGIQNGSRESAADVNNAKSFFGRATAVLIRDKDDQAVFQIGASFAARDRAVCSTCTAAPAYHADSSLRSAAVGVDVEWGGFRPGLHVIADVVTGDNVPAALRIGAGRNLANVRNSADSNLVTFRGAHIVAAYRIVTSGDDARTVKFIEPALRVDATDPDADVDGDFGLLITPAVSVYFGATVVGRFAFDVYRYRDAVGATHTANELKISWQANF